MTSSYEYILLPVSTFTLLCISINQYTRSLLECILFSKGNSFKFFLKCLYKYCMVKYIVKN